MPVQALAELSAVALRKFDPPVPAGQVRRQVARLRDELPTHPVTAGVVEEALRGVEAHQLPCLDAQSPRTLCHTYIVRNVTITLDAETALWARMEAASRDTSVSRFVGHVLRQHMLDDAEYARARRSYGQRSATALSAGGRPYPGRDEVHSR